MATDLVDNREAIEALVGHGSYLTKSTWRGHHYGGNIACSIFRICFWYDLFHFMTTVTKEKFGLIVWGSICVKNYHIIITIFSKWPFKIPLVAIPNLALSCWFIVKRWKILSAILNAHVCLQCYHFVWVSFTESK